MFEKDAEEYAYTKHCKKCISHCEEKCILVEDDYETFKQGAEFGYNKSKAETALLSQHILDLQKDKGNLTDRVRELEQQIEKMKFNIKFTIKFELEDIVPYTVLNNILVKLGVKENG